LLFLLIICLTIFSDVIWFIKAGLRFLNIAGRVTKNLVDSENVDRLAMLTKNERGDTSRKRIFHLVNVV